MPFLPFLAFLDMVKGLCINSRDASLGTGLLLSIRLSLGKTIAFYRVEMENGKTLLSYTDYLTKNLLILSTSSNYSCLVPSIWDPLSSIITDFLPNKGTGGVNA